MRLPTLLFTVFIDSLGFGLVFPLLPPLFMHEASSFLEGTSLETRGLLLGVVIASFCLGQLLGAPVLGMLSDRKGRKKILLFTIYLACIGYTVSGVSILTSSVSGLLMSRICLGIAAGNYAVAQSIVVDVSRSNEKMKNFALLGMAWGGGFTLGPYMGGVFSDSAKCSYFGFSAPFWIAAVLCALNALLVKIYVKESLVVQPKVQVKWLAGIFHLKKAFHHKRLREIFLVMFIFCLGWGVFTEFASVFLMGCIHASVKEIANFFAVMGLWIAASQGIFVRPFIKRFSPGRLLSISLFGFGFLLMILLFIKHKHHVYIVIPFLALCESFIFPSAATLVSNLSENGEQGEVLGIYNSVQWAAIGFPPLLLGAFIAQYPHLPIVLASFCMFVGCFCFLYKYLKRNKALVVD